LRHLLSPKSGALPESCAVMRAICVSRLATCCSSARTSASVKVGSSVASNCPLATWSPSRTSMLLMIDGSRAW
jgi:hypothetical protein